VAFTSYPASGETLTAAKLQALISELRPITASKSATTSRNTTTTETADPHLVLPLLANRTYDVKGVLLVTSAANAAGDFRCSFTFPTGATVSSGAIGVHDSLASLTSADGQFSGEAADATSPTAAVGYGASTSVTAIQVELRVAVGANAGNLTLQWAQLASNANNTNLLSGSWLTATTVV